MVVSQQRSHTVSHTPAADHNKHRLTSKWSRVTPVSPAFPTPAVLLRIVVLALAGALPVCSIPLFVFGLLPLSASALGLVLPFGIIAAVLTARQRSSEAVWALRGVTAGLFAVAAYDSVRFPLIAAGIWSDFIPRLGGWILGTNQRNIPMGYFWRYLGDGGGIGLVFFLLCGAVLPYAPLVRHHPIVLAVGYGIFVWSGLVGTILLAKAGPERLFRLTPTTLSLSLVGHLVYGSVLGILLRRHLIRDTEAMDIRRAA